VGAHELRGFACQEMPRSILAMHPGPNVPKKGRDKVFSFCSMKRKMLGNTLV
jgi:hypothetical protein